MFRPASPLVVLSIALAFGCSGDAPEDSASDASAVPVSDPGAPPTCATCHSGIVESFARHGMAASLGPVRSTAEGPAEGIVRRSRDGVEYRTTRTATGTDLLTTFPDGRTLRQRIVGRIGAGKFDVSWVTSDLDPSSGQPTGRLYFAPIETVTGHGLELSPFELHAGSPGPRMALTEACFVCHTDTPVETVSGAARGPGGTEPFPANQLGAGAFEQLRPIGCDGCHGSSEGHIEAVQAGSPGDDLGIERLTTASADRLHDVCARCHLQGDARLELADPREPGRPFAAAVANVVTAVGGDEFRFVGQHERLSLSACFTESAEMTCVTCHDPHRGVREQGIQALEAACIECHSASCSRPTDLEVTSVTGETARTAEGCVDCHVRRSQPFDLPHIRTADHFIRRRIPPPRDDVPHRAVAAPEGDLRLAATARIEGSLATPEGELWRDGVLAVAAVVLGRPGDAGPIFDRFPEPGSPEALRPTAPAPLVPLETLEMFHQARGVALATAGRMEEARAAWSDALRVDPNHAASRIERARARLAGGDTLGFVEDTEFLVRAYPDAEAPWLLRAEFARRAGRPDMVQRAITEALRRNPAGGR